jgi:uncharacterized protein (TIGR02246 family)
MGPALSSPRTHTSTWRAAQAQAVKQNINQGVDDTTSRWRLQAERALGASVSARRLFAEGAIMQDMSTQNPGGLAVDDLVALRALVDQYALAVDARDSERFAAVFTPDGVLQGLPLGHTEPTMHYAGRDQLRNVIGDRASRFLRTFHVIANHTCERDGDEAVGIAYCMAHHLVDQDGALTDILMLIRYHDRYSRAAGDWRIAHRDVVRHWTTTTSASY